MIYISTGAEKNKKATEIALQYYKSGIDCVELSGGLYSENCQAELFSLPNNMKLQIHNYYPAPKIPFVFNLASEDADVGKRSFEHVQNAIRLAALIDRPVYSFHAGFRINPSVCELGSKLIKRKLTPRAIALDVFGQRIDLLAEEARKEGVRLLIENNVINKNNLSVYGEDPLLLTHPDEIVSFMEKVPTNVGLLLDVAHMKVSAKALSFDMHAGHEQVKKWIKGYHLSDNDGEYDTNDPIADDSWFWGGVLTNLDLYTLEVYNQSPNVLLQQKNLIKSKITEDTQHE